jgi:hypothetical protein
MAKLTDRKPKPSASQRSGVAIIKSPPLQKGGAPILVKLRTGQKLRKLKHVGIEGDLYIVIEDEFAHYWCKITPSARSGGKPRIERIQTPSFLGAAGATPGVERDTDPIQEAFRKDYTDFVDAPLKRIESNWSKMGDSLARMEKKLVGVTA